MTDTTPDLAPLLASQIQPAPGRGIIGSPSLHVPNAAHLFHVDAQPSEAISDGLSRQWVSGANGSFVKWTARKGAVVPLHHHLMEQYTWITEGLAEVYSQGRRYEMRAGDFLIIPPNVPHEFHFLEDTIDIDFFAPGRQDWLDAADA